MSIETTVNLSVSTLEKITDAGEKLGIPRSAVISSLMRHMSRRYREYVVAWKRVKYQQGDVSGGWRRLHVSVGGDEYEFFLDTRKLFKMSVSFIISVAVERYLDELFALIEENGDSYRYQNYALMQIDVENVISWIIYWGIPPQILTNPSPAA